MKKVKNKTIIKEVEKNSTKDNAVRGEITGIYHEVGAFGVVIPDDRREIKEILILQGSEGSAGPGDRVIVKLTAQQSYRNLKKNAGYDYLGKVVEVLGPSSDPKVSVQAVIRRLGLRQEFSPRLLAAADKLNQPVSEEKMADRLDLRDELIVTIDGEDTRDIDDAISLEVIDGGLWRLGVHIADVAAYIKEGSLLDREAFARSTSVYFPDLVLPMLPPAVSNGICSLNAGEDRLAMSCIMTIDGSGDVVDYEIRPSVIRVREKLTYPQVQGFLNRQGWSTKAALAGEGGVIKHKQPEKLYFNDRSIEPMIMEMAKLALVLREVRFKRGAIDFEFPECKIIMAEDGSVENVVRHNRMLSEMIIEEFMIKANETVATHYHRMGIPFLYRVHEKPGLDSIRTVNTALAPFGISLQYDYEGNISPKAYQKVLQQVQGLPEETVVANLLLRSMAHARYSREALGHFGLASKYYSHFTSPIRRYADLAIHRVIKTLGMTGKLSKEEQEKLKVKMERYAEQTSFCERIAEEAERKVDALKKAEYMQRFVGEEFEGVISGVTGFGFYVELPNTVEGLVHISSLDDYYEFDEGRFRLYSQRTHKSFKIGDKVRVRLVQVDVAEGYINFELVEKVKEAAAGKNNGKTAGLNKDKKVKKKKAKKSRR